MKKQFGIWLDFREAYIIELTESESKLKKVSSGIESFNPKGGSHSKMPWGSTDKISEGKYLARRKQQENAYYEELIKTLSEADELYIFGPAEAKDGLHNKIKSNKGINVNIKGIRKVDSMTDNQKVAEVRSFFNGLK